MSRRNYNTSRNKLSPYPPPPVVYTLKDKEKTKLVKNKPFYDEWELSFYKSLEINNFKIISEKQLKIVRRLLQKKSC